MSILSVPRMLQRVALYLVIGLAIAIPSLSWGADPVRETRTLSDPFDAVRLSGDLELQLIQGDVPALVLEADPRILPHIKTQVRDGTLEVRYEGVHVQMFSSSHPRVILTAKSLRRIATEGSGDIHSQAWNTPISLDVALSGAGDVHFADLIAPKISVHIMGSGDIELAGTVPDQEVRISGAGDYDAKHLKSSHVTVNVAGAGDVVVWATDSLAISVAGAGDVRYYGHPSVTRSIAGMGDIQGLGDAP